MKGKIIEILFSGFGGQGVMFMGKLIAQAGLNASRFVTWMPAYGAEVRGGTAYSVTKISDGGIANPIITAPDILVAMNEPSLVKYEGKVKPGGMIILNKSIIDIKPKRKDLTIVSIPMMQLAASIGNIKFSNMIAIGALIKRSKLFTLRAVTTALSDILPNKPEILLSNKKALEKGYSRA